MRDKPNANIPNRMKRPCLHVVKCEYLGKGAEFKKPISRDYSGQVTSHTLSLITSIPHCPSPFFIMFVFVVWHKN